MCKACTEEALEKARKWIKILTDSYDENYLEKQWEIFSSPFVDRDKFKKEENKILRILVKFYEDKNREFNKRFRQLKNSKKKFFIFKWDEITETQMTMTIKDLFIYKEMQELYITLFAENFTDFFYKELIDWLEVTYWAEFWPIKPLTQAKKRELTSFYKKFATRYVDKINVKLKDTIAYWFVEWKSVDNIARDINKNIKDFWWYRAKMVARTECIRISWQVSQATYKWAWIKYYEVLPALNACPICTAIAAKNPYKIDDSSWVPSFHPNCRCSTIPVIE